MKKQINGSGPYFSVYCTTILLFLFDNSGFLFSEQVISRSAERLINVSGPCFSVHCMVNFFSSVMMMI
jgi:hypothetical protein